jgi:hypothetical protein
VTIGCRVLSTATRLSSPRVDAVAYIESPTITYPELHWVCKLLWMFTARRSVTSCKADRPGSLDLIGRVEPSGDSLILADRPVKSGGYAAAYSSWRRSQTSSEPPSLRPSGARSSSG